MRGYHAPLEFLEFLNLQEGLSLKFDFLNMEEFRASLSRKAG